MSDLFGNHIVGFPTRRLNCNKNEFCPKVLSSTRLFIMPPIWFGSVRTVCAASAKHTFSFIIYANAFKTLQMLWTWSEDMHVGYNSRHFFFFHNLSLVIFQAFSVSLTPMNPHQAQR